MYTNPNYSTANAILTTTNVILTVYVVISFVNLLKK